MRANFVKWPFSTFVNISSFLHKSSLIKTAVPSHRLRKYCLNSFKAKESRCVSVSSGYTQREIVGHEDDNGEEPGELSESHTPVMLREVLQHLSLKDNQIILDMTFGSGGHTKSILESAKNVQVIALDRDPNAFQLAVTLSKKDSRVMPLHGPFSNIKTLLADHGISKVDGVLMDLGVSSMQINDGARGFSYTIDGPLDMRMDCSDPLTAEKLINTVDIKTMRMIIKKYGEDKRSLAIASAICDYRDTYGRIKTTFQLSRIIASVFPANQKRSMAISARTFQAFRIFINDELNEINKAMYYIYDLLSDKGHCVVLSFHSLEDRIVKNHFTAAHMNYLPLENSFRSSTPAFTQRELQTLSARKWTSLTKHVVTPTQQEIEQNPRSRSAKLRSAMKNGADDEV